MERAYITFAPGDSRDEAVLEGVRWALDQCCRERPEVVLWVPHRDNLQDLPKTRRLVEKGLKVCADRPVRRGGRPTVPATGPVVAFCQPVERLVVLEPASHPVMLVGAVPEDLVDLIGARGLSFHQPWIDAYSPDWLSGPVIPRRRPLGEDSVLAAAMEDFTAATWGGSTMHRPDDGGRVIHGLMVLRGAGHQIDADELFAAALQQGWRGGEALRLREVAQEIAEGRNKRPAAQFDPAALGRWQSAQPAEP